MVTQDQRMEFGRLVKALEGAPTWDGYSIACVADTDGVTAATRLGATVLDLPDATIEHWSTGGAYGDEEAEATLAVTDVPGGCVLWQPWAYGAAMGGVLRQVSVGTVVYAMYANAKSGNQGTIYRDGQYVASDLHPGGGPFDEDDLTPWSDFELLYEGHAVEFCFAYTGLRPMNSRSVTGPPDRWLRLPVLGYWN